MGRRLDEVGKLTKKYHQQVASAAAGWKELVTEHADLELQKAEAESLHQALNLSWKMVAAAKGVVEKQRIRLNAAGATMAELKKRCDKASASPASCCMKLPQVQKNLEKSLEKVNDSSACTVSMMKKRVAVTTE